MFIGILFAVLSGGKRLNQIIMIRLKSVVKHTVLDSTFLPLYHLDLHLRNITSILG